MIGRHLAAGPRFLVIAAVGFSLAYGGYWIGASRASAVFEALYFDDALERELAEIRHDQALVRALAVQKYDASFELSQHRYFSRLLLIARAPGKQNPALQQLIKTQIGEGKTLQEMLSYRFPREEDNKAWAQLTK